MSQKPESCPITPLVKHTSETFSHNEVCLHNALTRAAHSLTLAEKRVISCSVSKLDSRQVWTPEKLKVKLTAAEYAEVFDLHPNTAYDELKSAADNLFQRYIRFMVKTRKGAKETKVRWVGRATYHDGEGWVEIVFWHEIAPYLFQLRREFTQYKLAQASALRSIYSWRLLELLMQFEDTGWRQDDVEAFAHAMDAPESCRKNFKDLRRRIIEPAVKELIEGWFIQWRPIKAGRKVKALRFEFERDPQGRLAF